jgi:autotransporter-associated beta strand protein
MKNTPRYHQIRQILATLTLSLLAAQLAPAATATWSGDSGVDTNWSTALNWTNGIVPATNNDVRFTDDGADPTVSNINNVVDTTLGILSLQYGNTNNFHTTLINSSVTLTNLGNLTVGTETDNGAAQTVNTTITGTGGALLVNSPSATVTVRQGSATSGSHLARLDMSGLGMFGVTAGRLLVGVGSGSIARAQGTLVFAATNTITLSGSDPQFMVGDNGQNNNGNSSVSILTLGQTNRINANTYRIGGSKQQGRVSFGTNWPSPSLVLRGSDGVSRASLMAVGDGSGASSSNPTTGNADFSGGMVDLLADTVYVGRGQTGSSTGTATGILTINAGNADVNTLEIGYQNAANANAVVTGTVNVNSNATLVVNSSLRLARTTGSTPPPVGTLNIASGATVSAPFILAGTNGSTTAVNVLGSTLNLTTTAGTPDAPLSSLILSNSILGLTVVHAAATNVETTSLTTDGISNLVQITFMPGIASYPATFRIIQALNPPSFNGPNGFNLILTNVPGGYTAYLTNNTTLNSVDMVVTAGPVAKSDVWKGMPTGDWDTSTMNWLSLGLPANYNSGDFVTFDDSASGTTTVNLTSAVVPSTLTVSNSTKAYTFNGSGSIAGPTALVKMGANTLTIANTGVNSFLGAIVISNGTLAFARSDVETLISGNVISGTGTLMQNGTGTLVVNGANNTFTGAVIVAQGVLRTGNGAALGATNAGTTINSGAALDVFGQNLGAEPITVSGGGVAALGGTNGAIINSGVDQQNALRYVTLAANTTFGGPGRWDIRGPNTSDASGASLSTGGNAYNLVKNGPGTNALVGVTVDPALANVDVQQGLLSFESATTSLGNPASTLTVRTNATFQMFNATNQLNKVISLNGDGVTTTILNASGANTIVGPITLNGTNAAIINAGGTSLSLNGAVGGTGRLTKNGGSPLFLKGNNTYTNVTLVNAGRLLIIGINTSSFVTNAPGSTLGGTGTNTGLVRVSGTINPGDVNLAGTFSCGPLTFSTNAFLSFDLGSTTTIGSGVNDLIQVTGSVTNIGTNSISISLWQGSLAAGTYRLINYSGSLVGPLNTNVTLVAGGSSRYAFTLLTNTAAQVNLAVAGSSSNLKWDSSSDSSWDVNKTTNWLNGASLDVFKQADSVLFDDSVAGVQTTVMITNGGMSASVITNNSSANSYTIIGSGKITGGASIVKLGSSTLTLGTTNDFLGPVTVQAGILRVTNNLALGATNGGTTILSGATLDVWGTTNNNTLNLGFEQITVSGPGVNNGGAIINSGPNSQQNAIVLLTLAGDTTVGGPGQWSAATGNSPGRWDIRGGGATLSTGGHPYNLTKTGNNQVSVVGAVVDTNLANIDIQQGNLDFENNTTSMGNPSSNLTVEAGATLGLFQSGTGTNFYTKHFALFGDGVSAAITNTGGSSTLNGPMSLSGSCIIGVNAGGGLTNNCIISDNGSLTKNGPGTLLLSATNTYTGSTLVSTGTLALIGTGSIATSPTVTVPGPGTFLDASGRSDGTFSLGSGQVLTGSGTVRGSVSNSAVGAAIIAGDASANPLIISSNLVLNNGSNVFVLNVGGMDAMIVVSNNLTLQGVSTLFMAPAGQLNVNDLHTNIIYSGTLSGVAANLQVSATRGYAFEVVNPGLTLGSIVVQVKQVPLTLDWNGPGSSWDTSTFNWLIHGTGTPTNFVNGEVALFNDTPTVTNVTLVGALDPIGIDMENNSEPYIFTGSGHLTGGGELILNGSGSLTLANSGSNDFSGDVSFTSSELLQVGGGGTSGNLGAVSGINLTPSGATLAFDRSDNINVPNVFNGQGTISNLGPGVVTLSGKNLAFTGAVGVAQGTLRVNNNFALGGAGNGGTFVASGATLDLGGPNLPAGTTTTSPTTGLNLSNTTVTVSGGGALSTNGAIVNNSTNAQENALRFVTLTDNTTFGGTARWDIRGTNADLLSDASAFLRTGSNPYKLTKVGTNQISLVGVNVDSSLGDIDVLAGVLSIEHATTTGDSSKTLTVTNGATLQVWAFPTNNNLNKVLALYGNGVTATITNGSGNNRSVGPVTLYGSPIFAVPGTSFLTNDGNISGSGTLIKTLTGRLVLQGTDTYTGNTVVEDGRLTFTGSQAIPPSPVFDLQTNTSILDLHNAGGILSLGTGQTIKGKGSVWGSVDAGAAAIVTPGESIGTLSVTNSVTFETGSTNVMEIDKAGATFDQIRANSIAYGGTLVVSNLNLQLANGDAFKLYTGTNGYSGAFSQIIPAAPAAGFYWYTNTLTTDGTLRIASTVTNTPQATSTMAVGTNIVVSGINGIPNGQYYLLSSTSVALPLANWSRVSTNFFNGSGGFSFTNSASLPQRFFVLLVPY